MYLYGILLFIKRSIFTASWIEYALLRFKHIKLKAQRGEVSTCLGVVAGKHLVLGPLTADFLPHTTHWVKESSL